MSHSQPIRGHRCVSVFVRASSAYQDSCTTDTRIWPPFRNSTDDNFPAGPNRRRPYIRERRMMCLGESACRFKRLFRPGRGGERRHRITTTNRLPKDKTTEDGCGSVGNLGNSFGDSFFAVRSRRSRRPRWTPRLDEKSMRLCLWL